MLQVLDLELSNLLVFLALLKGVDNMSYSTPSPMEKLFAALVVILVTMVVLYLMRRFGVRDADTVRVVANWQRLVRRAIRSPLFLAEFEQSYQTSSWIAEASETLV